MVPVDRGAREYNVPAQVLEALKRLAVLVALAAIKSSSDLMKCIMKQDW